jgi:hypothetical protein
MRTQARRLWQALRNVGGALGWTMAGAALLAPLGAAMGLCLGAVQLLLYASVAPLWETVMRMALCLAVVGALLGAFIRIIDGVNPFAENDPESVAPPAPVARALDAHRRTPAAQALRLKRPQDPSLN